METVLWILLCMLAFVGAVEIFGRLFYGTRPRKPCARGTLLIHLRGEAAVMRETLEYYRAWVEWNGEGHRLLFLCNDADELAQSLFEHYLGDMPGAELAEKSVFRAQILEEE